MILTKIKKTEQISKYLLVKVYDNDDYETYAEYCIIEIDEIKMGKLQALSSLANQYTGIVRLNFYAPSTALISSSDYSDEELEHLSDLLGNNEYIFIELSDNDFDEIVSKESIRTEIEFIKTDSTSFFLNMYVKNCPTEIYSDSIPWKIFQQST